MAVKIHDIYIKHLDDDPYFFSVYSDLTLEQIKTVAGVSSPHSMGDHINFTVDPRYDPSSVEADIRALVKPKPLRTHGIVGFWTSVCAGLPHVGQEVIVRGDFGKSKPRYYVAAHKFRPTGPRGPRREWVSNGHQVLYNVTAWTPIPE